MYVYLDPERQHPKNDHGDVWLKIGMSEADCYGRFLAQSRGTNAPDPMVLVRVYPCQDARGAEQKFHAILADANTQRGRTGREWFVTNLEHLDAIASSIGLEPAFRGKVRAAL